MQELQAVNGGKDRQQKTAAIRGEFGRTLESEDTLSSIGEAAWCFCISVLTVLTL